MAHALTRPSPARPRAIDRPVAHKRRSSRAAALAVLVGIALGCSDRDAIAGQEAPATDPLIMEIDKAIKERPIDKKIGHWRTQVPVPPLFKFDPKKKYFWKLKTNQGDIVFRMMPDVAPRHVGSTFYLTRLGFYDSLGFHRVIKGFMAQGGDPLGNGRGAPGFKYYGEFDPKVTHDGPGVLSMANAGPGTDGSQFFITFAPAPSLNGRHTVFGKAESSGSLATLRKMEALGRPNDPAPPTSPIVIERATILVQ